MNTQVKSESGYILIATGEYSDYALTAYRVLKPFTLLEAYKQFEPTWVKPAYHYRNDPGQDDFIAWLNKEGYIQDADDLLEVHVGCYGDLEIDEAQANILFCPKGKSE